MFLCSKTDKYTCNPFIAFALSRSRMRFPPLSLSCSKRASPAHPPLVNKKGARAHQRWAAGDKRTNKRVRRAIGTTRGTFITIIARRELPAIQGVLMYSSRRGIPKGPLYFTNFDISSLVETGNSNIFPLRFHQRTIFGAIRQIHCDHSSTVAHKAHLDAFDRNLVGR